jgi:hypothetical protein
MDFLINFGSVVTHLSSLLNIQFIEGNKYHNTYLGQRFKWILEFHNLGEFIERDAEILKVALLAKNLKEVRQHNEEAFSQFKRSIKKCMKAADFYGLRMEIQIASSLARKNINFTKRESPDFEITVNGQKVFIECTSLHFSATGGNPDNKIIGAIRKKAHMPYANNNTALFIDFTNLLSISDRSVHKSIREIIEGELTDENYGSIMLFSYAFYDHGKSIVSHYTRIDSKHISKTLHEFIDKNFPRGKIEPQTHWIPDQV